MHFFDIHSHINFPQYTDDRDMVIARMKDEGIGTVTVGTHMETSREAVELARAHEHLYACVGVHPVDEKEAVFDKDVYADLASNPKVVAVGETGLDYFHADVLDAAERTRQRELFEAHIQFALTYDKPLMIHCRDAYKDVLDILESYVREHGERVRGNMHFFAGSVAEARRVLDLGFMISFTGVITFAEQYREAVAYVPLERMMAETDAPFASPEPHRGKRNEPIYVKHVYTKIADIRGKDEGKVREIITGNALRFFGI